MSTQDQNQQSETAGRGQEEQRVTIVNRQQRRALQKVKNEKLRAQAKVLAALNKPEVRLSRLEAIVLNKMLPELEEVKRVLRQRGLIVEKTEGGVIVPP